MFVTNLCPALISTLSPERRPATTSRAFFRNSLKLFPSRG